MNEILAVLVLVFFSEYKVSNVKKEKHNEAELQQLSNEQIIDILFNEKHIYADIFWCFHRIMSLGVKQLYQVTKDMATLKKEIISQIQNDSPANSQKEEKKNQSPEVQKREFDNQVRERLEIAYEDEK